VKLDTSLVGDNNNKETAPTLFIYIRLLLITPTRAVHVFLSAEVILPPTGCRARRAWCFAGAKRRQTPQRSGAQRGRIVAEEGSAADSPKKCTLKKYQTFHWFVLRSTFFLKKMWSKNSRLSKNS
jgi:hypothetical protein